MPYIQNEIYYKMEFSNIIYRSVELQRNPFNGQTILSHREE